jgi:transposase InsO family protein
MEHTEDRRRRKVLFVIDEFTRECLEIEVARHLTAHDVLGVLGRLFKERGAPQFIRSDNGPGFVGSAIKEWLAKSGVETLYLEPGNSWQNAYRRASTRACVMSCLTAKCSPG